MTAGTRCGCGSMLGLRDVLLDSASGPLRTVTCCDRCAPAAEFPLPEGVARILARRGGIHLPAETPLLRPER